MFVSGYHQCDNALTIIDIAFECKPQTVDGSHRPSLQLRSWSLSLLVTSLAILSPPFLQ